MLEEGRLFQDSTPTIDDSILALCQIICKCRSRTDNEATSADADGSHVYKLCTWSNESRTAISIHKSFSVAELTECLRQNIHEFLSEGGASLLVMSVVATFGSDRLRRLDGGITPLVSDIDSSPYQLCTTGLMSLLLMGDPRETLHAYDPQTGALLTWSGISRIGFLSGSEMELKIRIADTYKFPSSEVQTRAPFSLLFPPCFISSLYLNCCF